MGGRWRSERGFSLVEVILALGLLAAVLISIAGLFVIGNRQVKSGRTHSTALSVARQVLEEINGWSFERTYTAFGLDGSAASYVVRTDVPGYAAKWQPPLAELQGAHAEILLESVVESGSGPALAVAPVIRVVVTVLWSEGERPRRVRLAMVRL